VSDFALREIHELMARRSTSPLKKQILWYVCALFSALAYEHIPQNEIDHQRRVKFVPCDAYQRLAAKGPAVDVATIFQNVNIDLPRPFVVISEGVIAVGTLVRSELFIAFRGTQHTFADWSTNLLFCLRPAIAYCPRHSPFAFSSVHGRIHAGFGREARRISGDIYNAISRQYGRCKIDHIFLTGHSLGGAVAAIVGRSMDVAPKTICIFGSPRYCDEEFNVFKGSPPTQIRRPSDLVPTIPPTFLGYADHRIQARTDGGRYVDSRRPIMENAHRHWRFVSNGCKDHFMEPYRRELGISIGAKGSCWPLVPS
jgi:hypothetical protein